MVLLVVFGVLVALVGVTATSQAVMVSVYASTSTLNAIVQSDVATLRGFVHQGLNTSIVDQPDLNPQDRAALEGLLATLQSKGEILRAELRSPSGLVIVSSDPSAAGELVPPGPEFAAALGGAQVQVSIVDRDVAEVAGTAPLEAASMLREYLPLSIDGEVRLVVGIWRDAAPFLGGLDLLRRDVVAVTITAALIAALVLYLVFRSAQGRLSRQAQALVEAGQRDALTGTLNHGALVGLLATEIEFARRAGATLGLALIDLDGFRLLNDTHGHGAGDQALQTVADLLQRTTEGALFMGRYGPDEFLVVSIAHDAEGLRAVVDEVRAGLAELSLQFASTERLPVTVSAGLCTYPAHGSSVTTLLATAARTVEEAKAGGGDMVRMAQAEPADEAAATSSFDVLKGLVIAVDTKDRYTKRHSEDVARYAVFIARRLGLDEEMIRTIHVAGLLHDIGKIGIPDAILRKPGRLTEAEEAVIRQHVALGDLIVRELPDVDIVRAGIRHHHERWDGRGYLDGLGGEDIPLIARILAVGDAFSAMTTSRPYRKALSVDEALKRLGDGAGSQLDETMVRTFINGLGEAENPPLPGIVEPGILWSPMRRAA